MISPSSSPLHRGGGGGGVLKSLNAKDDLFLNSKRKQVKNACIHCQKACKKCDDLRPCTRCIKYGLEDSCEDSRRKLRKRGQQDKDDVNTSSNTSPSTSNNRMTTRQIAISAQQRLSEITEEKGKSKKKIRISLNVSPPFPPSPPISPLPIMSAIFPPPIHTPLFNRVLNSSPEINYQPPIGDLASICSDILLMETQMKYMDPLSPPKTPIFFGKTIYTPLSSHNHLHSPSPKNQQSQKPSFLDDDL